MLRCLAVFEAFCLQNARLLCMLPLEGLAACVKKRTCFILKIQINQWSSWHILDILNEQCGILLFLTVVRTF